MREERQRRTERNIGEDKDKIHRGGGGGGGGTKKVDAGISSVFYELSNFWYEFRLLSRQTKRTSEEVRDPVLILVLSKNIFD